MDTALAVEKVQKAVAHVGLSSRLRSLRDSFLKTLSPHTRLAYSRDLLDFASFLGEDDSTEAVLKMMRGGQGEANSLALSYKANLLERGLSPSTVNRRLAALRSTVRLARTGGLVAWGLEIRGEKSHPYRDTRGPGRDGFRRMLERVSGSSKPRAIRDRAILRLLYDLALRRGEVARLNREDVDLEGKTLKILGKGRREPEKLTLPDETAQALGDWIGVRGEDAGPLFRNYDHSGKRSEDGRLTADGIYRMVRALGKKAGIKTRPHGLRHAAITEALELTKGNLVSVRDFSRHQSFDVLRFYDDARGDRGGEVARLVAAAATFGCSLQ